MKTETGYLYEINGEVFVNPEEEPSKFLFYDDDIHLKESEYKKALKAWQAKCIPVVNANVSYHPMEGYEEIIITKPVYQIVDSGQKCEHSVKNGKSTISKML